jgi:antitoxin ParD1/3/4
MDHKSPNDSMNIALPEGLKKFVHEQVSVGGYASASEYIRELIREAQRRHAQDEIETLLAAGIQSGPAAEVDEHFWKELHDRSSVRWRKRATAKG